jgi:hypothetical protein
MFRSASRRAFFRRLVTAPAALWAPAPPRTPQTAWIVLQLCWEGLDDWVQPQGVWPLPQLYFERAAAERVCARLTVEFFEHSDPAEFGIEPWILESLPDGLDEANATWEQIREAGFPDPYEIQELKV